MTTRTKLAMMALTAAFVLAAALGTASARRLGLSDQRIRVVWSFLKYSDAASGLAIECPVTLEGSFHGRTITKTSGLLIGVITRAAVGAFSTCRNRANVTAITILQTTLPWHIRYNSFTGRLPSIETIRMQLIGAAFLLTAFNVSCLYKSDAIRPALADASLEGQGIIQDVRPVETAQILIFEGMALCPGSGVFTNGSVVTALVTVLGTTTRVIVTLVP